MTIATAGGLGIAFTPNDRQVFNRTGSLTVAGDLHMFDILRSAGETTGSAYGESSSMWANVVVPTAAATVSESLFAAFCVVTRGAADDQKEVVQVTGKVMVKVTNGDAGNPLPIGSPLWAAATNALHGHAATPVAGKKILGILQTALGNGATAVVEVDFDGIHGFGSTSVT